MTHKHAPGHGGSLPPSGIFLFLERLALDALARNPGDVSARTALAELLCARGDYRHAFMHFHQALSLAPNNVRLVASLAKACRDIGEEESFRNLLRRLRRLDPQHVLVRTTAWSSDEVADLFQGHRIYEIDH